MAGFRLLDGINGKGADCVDCQLIEIVVVHASQLQISVTIPHISKPQCH